MTNTERRKRAIERYNLLAAPFVDRMMNLRLLFTEPRIVAGGHPAFEWTNDHARRLYEAHGHVLSTLLIACVHEEMQKP